MTRVRRVEDWMAGQLVGSRRSSSSCFGRLVVCFDCWIK